MSRFGVTTIARWLAEKLPSGVVAYVNCDGKLFELFQVCGCNGGLIPRVLTKRIPGQGIWYGEPRDFGLDTPVFLSLGEDLTGVDLKDIIGCTDPAAVGSPGLQHTTPEIFFNVS